MVFDGNKNETFVYVHINNHSHYKVTLLYNSQLFFNKTRVKRQYVPHNSFCNNKSFDD